MKIFFTIDDKKRVKPCCDWTEDFEPDFDWLIGDTPGDNAYEEHGIPVWKYENNKIIFRSQKEIQVDIDELPIPEPTEAEQLRADVDFLTMENETLESQAEQARADIDYLLMITEEE